MNKMIVELEKKIQSLIDELNQINKEAEEGGNYKYLSDKYIWKMRILKETEKKLIYLFKQLSSNTESILEQQLNY